MLGNFNEEAQNILINAKTEMSKLGHPYIGTEHLILAILGSDINLSSRLKGFGLSYDNFKEELCKIVGISKKKIELFLYTPLLRKVIENAILDSKENNDGEVTAEHLFFSLLEEGEGIAIRILIGMNIDVEAMYDEFSSSLIKKNKKIKKRKLLIEELGVDITNKARNNELDPVIGRDKEVKRLMEILCRRTKNNPILIGEAGVGKTAIVEELSRLIANGDVPNNLGGKRIISLDMATAVAGTKYRGEFEDRMKKILKEIEENDDIILFIDEIHTLVGAGGAEGAIDASNILKPALARGKIRCIGATTTQEYKKYIEKDAALERRFQKIFIKEPTILETKNILLKIRPIYEKYHNVSISEEVIDAIISLSEKYIYDRNRPDKEIDIMDEVSSKVSMKESKEVDKIRKLKREIDELNKEKNEYIIDNNIEKAYDIRKQETFLMSSLNKCELSYKVDKKIVTSSDVALVINSRTNIPIYEILDNNIESIRMIHKGLKEVIIGQDDVVNNLVDITKRIKLGYKNNSCYSYLFVGPSGVGKSLLAKTYAKLLVGEDNFIRLDMSEFSDVTSVNKILGSAPGYVGYDDNKNILEEVRNKPNSVILLDEIDKAHHSVINLFYQILEEGKIKDSKGNIVRFDNAIILMTSNVGFERNSIGFNNNREENVLSDLKSRFNNAFINRIDNVIIFNRLGIDEIKAIVRNNLASIREKYDNIKISFSTGIVDEIVNSCDYYDFGARKINKIISKNVENMIIDSLIQNRKSIKISSLENKRKSFQ